MSVGTYLFEHSARSILELAVLAFQVGCLSLVTDCICVKFWNYVVHLTVRHT